MATPDLFPIQGSGPAFLFVEAGEAVALSHLTPASVRSFSYEIVTIARSCV
jgi:hypothetical protein